MGLRDIFKAFTDQDAEYLLNDTIKVQFDRYDEFRRSSKNEEADHHAILSSLWAFNQFARNNAKKPIPLELQEILGAQYQCLGFLTTALLSIMSKDDACTMMGCQFYLLTIKDSTLFWQEKSKNTIKKAEKIIENISTKYAQLSSDMNELGNTYISKNPISCKSIDKLFPGKSIVDLIQDFPNLQKELISKFMC